MGLLADCPHWQGAVVGAAVFLLCVNGATTTPAVHISGCSLHWFLQQCL